MMIYSQSNNQLLRPFYLSFVSSFLWCRDIPDFLQNLFFWMTNLQLIVFSLWFQINIVIKTSKSDSFTYSLQKFTKVLTLKEPKDLSDSSLNFILIVAWIYMTGLVLFILMRIIKLKFRQKVKNFSIVVLSQFHLSVFFMIINTILASNSSSVSVFNDLFIGDKARRIVNVTLIIFNLIITLFMAVFSYDPLRGSNKYSSHTPLFQVFTFLAKAIFTGYDIIFDLNNLDQSNTWMFAALSLLILMTRHYHLTTSIPYHKYSPQKISMVMSSITLLISSFSLLALVLGTWTVVSDRFIVYVEFLFAPFAIKATVIHLREIIENNSGKDIKEINNETEIIKMLFSLDYLITRTSLTNNRSPDSYDIRYWGKISSYIESVQPDGNENYPGPQIRPNQNNKIIENIVHQNLSNFVKKFPSNLKIKFLLANNNIEQNTNLVTSISFLVEIANQRHLLQPSANQLVEDIQSIIHNYFKNKEDSTLNIKNFIDFDFISIIFVKKIHANSIRFLAFWEIYKKPNHELAELLKKSALIELEDYIIKEIWNKDIQNQKMFASSLYGVYATYLRLIRNAPFSALRLKKKYEALDYQLQGTILKSENLISLDNIAITISMSRKNIGTVLHASANVKRSLGWTELDLVGKNIDILLIPFLRAKHNHVLLNHLEGTSNPFMLDHGLESVVMNKENKISHCCIHVSIHPYVQQELRYTGIIRLLKVDKEILILNQNGDIESSTKHLGNELNLTKTKKVNIRDVCWFVQILDEDHTKDLDIEPKRVKNSDFEKVVSLKKYSKHMLRRKSIQVDSWKLIQNTQGRKFLTQLGYLGVEKKHLESQELKKYSAVLKLEKIDDLEYYVLYLKNYIPIDSNSNSLQEISQHEQKVRENQDSEASEVSEVEIRNVKSKENDNSTEINPKFEAENTESAALKTSCRPLILTNAKRESYSNKMKIVSKKNTIKIENNEQTQKKSEEKTKFNGVNSIHSSSDANLAEKIEEAVYTVQKNRNLMIINIIVLILIILTILLLVIFGSKNSKRTEEVKGLVTVISASTMQLLVLAEHCRLSLIQTLIDRNVYAIDRFNWANIPDVRMIVQIRLDIEGGSLENYCNIVRNSMHLLDKDVQGIIFQKIPVIDWDSATNSSSIRETDTFNLLTEILRAGRKIVITPYQDLSSRNKDIAFIFNNSRGDLLIASENIVRAVVRDTISRIENFPNLLILFISITGVIGLVFLGFLFKIQRKLLSERNRLLEIFLRLDEKEIQNRLDEVKILISLLEKNNMDGTNFKFKTRISQDNNHVKMNNSSFTSQRRIARRKQLNLNLIKITISSLLLVMLLFFGYTILMLLLLNQNKVVQAKVNMLVDCNLNFYEFAMLLSDTYEYLSSNDTAVLRGRSIKEEWDHTFKRVSELQQKVIQVTDNQQGLGGSEGLVNLIKGNLCAILLSDPYAGAQCASLIYGIVPKGIIQINTFLMSLVQRAKQSFDSSNKTAKDAFDILANMDYVQAEPVWVLYLLPGYQLINKIISEQLVQDLENYKETVTITLTLFATTCFIIGILLWWNIKVTFQREILRWKEMLRLIPDTVVADSKILKAYLMSNSMSRLV